MSNRQISRRSFLKESALSAGAVLSAPAILEARNPNLKVGLGCIGVGHQGTYNLMRWAKEIPGVEIRAVNDVWDSHLNRGKTESNNPHVTGYTHYQDLLNDKSIDAVIIATPDHWHVPIALDAVDAGKHIYCEKALTVDLDLAKKFREKFKGSGLVFQLGHGGRSRGPVKRGREIFNAGGLGKVTFVRCHYFRNSRISRWLDRPGETIPVPADLTLGHLDWEQFCGPAPQRPFDPVRYLRWRNYWDYGTGIAGDLLSHHLDSINFTLNSGVPHSCITTGGIYYWDDGRETPDHWNAIYDWPEKDLSVTFSCEFNSSHYGTRLQYFGSEAAMEVGSDIKVYPEEVSDKYSDFIDGLKRQHNLDRSEPLRNIAIPAIYQWSEADNLYRRTTLVGNFIDAIRDGVPAHCGIEAAFQEMATVMMSIESFRKGRKVIWDTEKEEIV